MGGRHRHQHSFLRNVLLVLALIAGTYIAYKILIGAL